MDYALGYIELEEEKTFQPLPVQTTKLLVGRRDLNPGPLAPQQKISIAYEVRSLKTKDLRVHNLDAKWTPKPSFQPSWTPRGVQRLNLTLASNPVGRASFSRTSRSSV
jgi:hypothetical protein